MDPTVKEHGRRFDRAFSGAALERASDERLVALTREGVDPAFEVIVRRYRPALVRYGSRFLDADRAEDVVQQSLVKALAALREDRRRMQLRPWLYRIVHNEALNASRRKELATEQLDENFDGVPQPPDVVARSERMRDVVAKISGLPARQRSAVVLRELEGRSYTDIATRLGVTTPVVRQLLHRARTRLRDTCGAILPLQAFRVWIEALTSPTGASAVKIGTAAVVTGVIASGAVVGASSRHVGSHDAPGAGASSSPPAQVAAPRSTGAVPTRRAAPIPAHAPARATVDRAGIVRKPDLATGPGLFSDGQAGERSPGRHGGKSGQGKDGPSRETNRPKDAQPTSAEPVVVSGDEHRGPGGPQGTTGPVDPSSDGSGGASDGTP